jgi:hypothetical protein
MHFDLEKLGKAIDLTDQSRDSPRGRSYAVTFLSIMEERKMKLLAAIAALCTLSGTALAETQDCKTLTDPAARLTCYDRITPPIATYPIPLPKPTHHIPLTRPDGTPGSADPEFSASSDSADDAAMREKMNSICRGC